MKNQKRCTVHTIPISISDDEISALLNGVISIIKRKVELETNFKLTTLYSAYNKLYQKLESSKQECATLRQQLIELQKNNTGINL